MESVPWGENDHCYKGSYTIRDETNVDYIKEFDCITGTLFIGSLDIRTIDVPNLKYVGERLIIEGNDNLHELRLGNLEYVGWDVTVRNNTYLGTLDLGELKDVGWSLHVEGTDFSAELNLSKLRISGRILKNLWGALCKKSEFGCS